MLHVRFSRALVFAALAVSLILPATAAARERFAVGFGFGAPFYPYYGYGAYPYYGYGYAPYGYGYGYGPYGYGRQMGEVHIKSPNSNAQIYINGSFAGRAHDLKTIYLAPGTYNVEQRIGSDVQKERIYVLANRSLKIEFDKAGAGSSPKPQANPPQPDARPQPAPNAAPNAVQPDSAPAPEANTAPQPPPAANAAPEVQR